MSEVYLLEDFNAAKQSKVPIPNIAAAFGVESITPFDMLRCLHVELQWREPE